MDDCLNLVPKSALAEYEYEVDDDRGKPERIVGDRRTSPGTKSTDRAAAMSTSGRGVLNAGTIDNVRGGAHV
jgi:hypothetical protein